MSSMSRLRTAGAAALILAVGSLEASAQIAEAPEPIAVSWQHDGVFGTFDRAAAQRGFQVYREVCSACHGLTYVAFRHLAQLGFGEEKRAQCESLLALGSEASHLAVGGGDAHVVEVRAEARRAARKVGVEPGF